MRTVALDASNISAAEATIPKDTPILMLNLLRWKTEAAYPNHPDLPPCSGQEAYLQRYVPAFRAVADRIPGIRVFWSGAALATIIAPSDERWDVAALIEYPSFAAFRAVVESEEYLANAKHHRLAALEDTRLIATMEMKMG